MFGLACLDAFGMFLIGWVQRGWRGEENLNLKWKFKQGEEYWSRAGPAPFLGIVRILMGRGSKRSDFVGVSLLAWCTDRTLCSVPCSV